MSHVIIGTAGHIDHGKTTLIKALTGRSTDTLKEEIKRGISINLGFTYFDLPNGKRAGIIDVPGHERFIRNMIAGASGIDIVMLVVAANEGVKPQTVEHLDILSYLNIKESIIVLTKCSLADELMRQLAADDIRERIHGTFIENAEIIEVDSVTGQGLNLLANKLAELSERVAERNTRAPARLYADRVFSMKGFGTVLTGTLMEGKISTGDELALYPGGQKARVRGIQVHEQSVAAAYAGQRTALNISNIKASEIRRGDVLAEPDSLTGTDRIDVKLSVTEHTQRQLRLWERVRLYIGSRELLARLVPLDTDALKAGDKDCLCQLRLEETAFVKKGDKFVIRYCSPMETVGGGVILDTKPEKHTRFSREAIEKLAGKAVGNLGDLADDYVRSCGEKGTNIRQIAAHISESEENTMPEIQELLERGVLIEPLSDGIYYHMETYSALLEALMALLSDYHTAFPLRKGINKEEARSRLRTGLKIKDFDGFLRLMEEEGRIKNLGGTLCLEGFEVRFDRKSEEIRQEMLKKLSEAGCACITEAVLTGGSVKKTEVLEALIPESAVRIADEYFMMSEYFEKSIASAMEIIDENGSVAVKDFRDRLCISRKFALIILEEMDRRKITKRVDDVRIRF